MPTFNDCRYIIGALALAAACNTTPVGFTGTSSDDAATGSGSSTAATGDTTALPTSMGDDPTTGAAATGGTGDDASSAGTTTATTTGEPGGACAVGRGDVYNSRSFANPGDEFPRDLAYNDDRILVAWSTEKADCPPGAPSLDFGELLPPDSLNGDDTVLSRYTPGLEHDASHLLLGDGRRSITGVDFDAAGNIYLAGFFTEKVEVPKTLFQTPAVDGFEDPFDKSTSKGFYMIFDSSGKHRESEDLRSEAGFDAIPMGIAAADDGKFVVHGHYSGDLSGVGPECPHVPAFESNGSTRTWGAFVRTYTANHDLGWTRCLAATDPEMGRVVTAGAAWTPDARIVITGDFGGDIVFTAEGITTAVQGGQEGPDRDGYVAIWDEKGHYAGHLVCASEVVDEVRDVVVEADGRIIIAGSIGDRGRCIDGAPGSTSTRGFVEAFYAPPHVLTPDFHRGLMPADPVGAPESEFYNVAVDACGDIVVSGFATGPLTWDDGSAWDEDANDNEDIILAKLARDGAPVWQRRWGTAGRDYAYGLAVDEFRGIYLSAVYSGAIPELDWPASDPDCPHDVGVLHLSP